MRMLEELSRRYNVPRPGGRRVREFARMAREAAEPTTDPKVMALTRSRPGEHTRPLARWLGIERQR